MDNGLGELESILVTRWFSSSIEYSMLWIVEFSSIGGWLHDQTRNRLDCWFRIQGWFLLRKSLVLVSRSDVPLFPYETVGDWLLHSNSCIDICLRWRKVTCSDCFQGKRKSSSMEWRIANGMVDGRYSICSTRRTTTRWLQMIRMPAMPERGCQMREERIKHPFGLLLCRIIAIVWDDVSKSYA